MAHAYFGEHSLMGLRQQALKAKAFHDKHKEKLREGVDAGIESLLVSSAAFGFGLANGKVGGGGLKVPYLGIPADLAAGVALQAYAFFGKGSEDRKSNCRAIANGALGSYFSTLGAQVGNQWRVSGKLTSALGLVSGDDDTTGGGAIADEELARMVRPA